jgi:hypothetical protein
MKFSTLGDRVAELESVVKRISQTFITFSKDLAASNVLKNYPGWSMKLRKVTDKCTSLAEQIDTETKAKGHSRDVSSVATIYTEQPSDRLG